ncbi:MAG: ammonium transporter [Bacteroidetes bacterium]|nr:ammonium transporter [Bacteroidota bacterium]
MEEVISQELFTINNLWMMIAAALVFIMHLGFSSLEIGFVRSKNVVNVLYKNALILPLGLVTYFICGFNLMYPGDFNGFIGFAGVGLSMPTGADGLIDYASGGYTYWTDFIFQAMFAATAATIVSGAVAERVKLIPFLLVSTFYVAFVYPILGSWHWGGGWLAQKGFYDFAGSTLVHSVGGWAALAAIWLLGPRIGKYINGKLKPIPGHSMPMAAVGVFLLWFGWFGFNGGSVLNADPALVSLVFVTTSLGAAGGAIMAAITAKALFKNYDLSMAFNGILGGLVSITAGADVLAPQSAIVVGGIGGMIIPIAVSFFDKLRLDDPVGATSVHLMCGIWGTLAVGIFTSQATVGVQALGVLAYGLGAFIPAAILFGIAKYTVGIRVSREEELEGLDLGEHGMEAYPNFINTPADGTNV